MDLSAQTDNNLLKELGVQTIEMTISSQQKHERISRLKMWEEPRKVGSDLR